jgi:hypothetical protein
MGVFFLGFRCIIIIIIIAGFGREKSRTFQPFVPGLALWAALASIFPFVIVARSAYRQCAFVAGDEEIAVDGEADIVPTNLAYMVAQSRERLRLEEEEEEEEEEIR